MGKWGKQEETKEDEGKKIFRGLADIQQPGWCAELEEQKRMTVYDVGMKNQSGTGT